MNAERTTVQALTSVVRDIIPGQQRRLFDGLEDGQWLLPGRSMHPLAGDLPAPGCSLAIGVVAALVMLLPHLG